MAENNWNEQQQLKKLAKKYMERSRRANKQKTPTSPKHAPVESSSSSSFSNNTATNLFSQPIQQQHQQQQQHSTILQHVHMQYPIQNVLEFVPSPGHQQQISFQQYPSTNSGCGLEHMPLPSPGQQQQISFQQYTSTNNGCGLEHMPLPSPGQQQLISFQQYTATTDGYGMDLRSLPSPGLQQQTSFQQYSTTSQHIDILKNQQQMAFMQQHFPANGGGNNGDNGIMDFIPSLPSPAKCQQQQILFQQYPIMHCTLPSGEQQHAQFPYSLPPAIAAATNAHPSNGNQISVSQAQAQSSGSLRLVIPSDEESFPQHVSQVFAVLRTLGLQQYFDTLMSNGYDDVRSLYLLGPVDLADMGFLPTDIQCLLTWTASSIQQPQQSLPKLEHNAAPISTMPTPGETALPPNFFLQDSDDNYISQQYVHSPYTFQPYAVSPATSPSGAVTPPGEEDPPNS